MHGQSLQWSVMAAELQVWKVYLLHFLSNYYVNIIDRFWIADFGFSCSEGQCSQTLNLQAQTVRWFWYLLWALCTWKQTNKWALQVNTNLLLAPSIPVPNIRGDLLCVPHAERQSLVGIWRTRCSRKSIHSFFLQFFWLKNGLSNTTAG